MQAKEAGPMAKSFKGPLPQSMIYYLKWRDMNNKIKPHWQTAGCDSQKHISLDPPFFSQFSNSQDTKYEECL